MKNSCWRFLVPVVVAGGSLAWAFLRTSVDCVREGDTAGCSDTGLVNVLVGAGGVLLAAIITVVLLGRSDR